MVGRKVGEGSIYRCCHHSPPQKSWEEGRERAPHAAGRQGVKVGVPEEIVCEITGGGSLELWLS